MILDNSYNTFKKIFQCNMKNSPHLRVLDIGCGARGNVYGIDPKVYVGIDKHGVLLKHLKKSLSGEYYAMDAGSLGFKDKFFDYVISVSLLHHLSNEELKKALLEVKRVLKKEGKIIFVDGVYPQSKLNIIGWMIRFFDRGRYVRSKNSLRVLLSKFFQIEEEHYFIDNIFAYSLFVMKTE